MEGKELIKFEVTKSVEDKRDYKGYILPNKLKVILVSDPSTEKSAAAVDVNIGTYRSQMAFKIICNALTVK